MAQQLNLLDARFAPKALRGTARQGLWAMCAVLLLGWLAGQGLHWAAGRTEAGAQSAQAELAGLRAQLVAQAASAPMAGPGELAQLQAQDNGQRRIRSALDAGVAGHREGYADYLVALSRQASDQLWITGFSVAEDGGAIALEGRMTDASALTHYLRRLNAEERFKGRPFAQLSLKSVDPQGGSPPYTEFALRSLAAATSTP